MAAASVPAGSADPILDRLHRELPELFPHYGTRHAQYLMSWRPVVEEGSRGGAHGLRSRLASIRRELRDELGIPTHAERPGWDRRIVAEHFWFLYEKDYVDPDGHGLHVKKYLSDVRSDFGDIDAVCLWQGYPRLGLDERSQFDYYRDLPGGMAELTRIVRYLQLSGVRVFLAYNPWDTGTRREPRTDADSLAQILGDTGADGVFLDTIESADPALLDTLHRARADVAVCPELIPPLADVTRVSGAWQQFASPVSPGLLAHRWLDPRFCLRLVDRYARSRAAQISEAFLHGSGHVVWENVFGWWNPWNDADRLLVKRTSMILREMEEYFRDPGWEPYVPTGVPGVYAMEWHKGESALFTLYNTNPDTVDDIKVALPSHCPPGLVDLCRGRELPQPGHGHPFSFSLGAGEVGCVLAGAAPPGLVFPVDAGESRRHHPVTLAAYEARPAPRPAAAPSAGRAPRDMVKIPACRFVMKVHRAVHADMEGGTYADIAHPTSKVVPDQYFWLPGYEIDRTPVTKAGFQSFLAETRYRPRSLDRFLADWERPPGTEEEPWRWAPREDRRRHPVTWVSLDDARAYASWAGLQLPTEAQWQRAAEGPRGRTWPWGDAFDASRCNGDSADTTAVDAFPAGASEEGCRDMSGNTWEWTESERDDGHTRYVMVRGGCHRRITGSSWYTASGAQPCAVHEKVPLMAGGIDRLSTVSFRCVRG